MTISEYIASDYQLYVWLDAHLWAEAQKRWKNASHEQRMQVVKLLSAIFEDADADEINNFVWFECDHIFFPDEGPADFTGEDLFAEIEGY